MNHFHTDVYPMSIKRVSCDKEIGNVKNGWRACNAKAHMVKESRTGQLLHYCTKHAPYGSEQIPEIFLGKKAALTTP